MKLIRILFMLCCFFWQMSVSFAQENHIDKLIKQARNARKDYKKQETITFYLQAISELRRDDSQKDKLINLYIEVGEYFLSVFLYEKALEYLLEARKRLGDDLKSAQQIEFATHLANAYFYNQNYTQALSIYEKLLNYYKTTTGNRKEMIKIMTKIDDIHNVNKNYNNAIAIKLEMLVINRSLRDSVATATTYNNIGYNRRLLNKPELAIQDFNDALKWMPKGKIYDAERLVTLNNLAITQQSIGSYNQAIENFNEAVNLAKKDSNNLEQSRLNNLLSATLLYRERYEDSKIYAEKAIVLATPYTTQISNQNIDQKIEAYKELENAYEIFAKVYQATNEYQQANRYIQLKADLVKIIASLQEEKQQRTDALKRQVEQTQLSISDTIALREAKKALDEQRKRSEAERLKAIADKQRAEAEAEKIKAEAETEKQRSEAQRRQAEVEKQRAETEKQKAEAERLKAVAEKQIAEAEAQKGKAEAQKQRLEAEKQKNAAEKQRYEAERKEAERKGQITQLILFAVGGGFILMLFLAYVMYRARNQQKRANTLLAQRAEEIEAQRQLLEHEKAKSETLLRNILPEEVANELKVKGFATPRSYEMVSVLFTDFKGFTNLTANMTPVEVIKELDKVFMEFDKITESHRLEKIKTIGDAYMCAGGIPIANETNPFDTILAGLEIQEYMINYKNQQIAKGLPYFQCRLGIHSGKVVAGVVGTKKFAYDIWGDTVNTASRMESSGEVELVNISGITYEIVKDYFECEYRGKIAAKNKGEVDMYFVKKLIKLPKFMQK